MNSDISLEQVQSPHLALHLIWSRVKHSGALARTRRSAFANLLWTTITTDVHNIWGYIYPQTIHICTSFNVSEGVMYSCIKARGRTLLFSISHAHFKFLTNHTIAFLDHAGKKKKKNSIRVMCWEQTERNPIDQKDQICLVCGVCVDLNRFSSKRPLIRCPWMVHIQRVDHVLFIWYSAIVAIFLLPPTTA